MFYVERGVTLGDGTTNAAKPTPSTILFAATCTTPDADEVTQFGLVVGESVVDRATRKVSFIAFVADGFKLEDFAGDADVESVSVTNYRGGNTIHAQDGYETMVVTVTLTKDGMPGSGIVHYPTLAVKAPTGTIPTTPSN